MRVLHSRRGQVNQVFILIVAVAVIVATVALSAKLLGLFESAACGVSDAGFREEIDRALDGASVFGSRDEVTIAVPCDAEALYLIDSAAGPISTGETTIDAALASGVRANVFVVVDGIAQEVGFDPRIITGRGPQDALLPEPFLVIEERRGAFVMRTEGFGRFVRVDEA